MTSVEASKTSVDNVLSTLNVLYHPVQFQI